MNKALKGALAIGAATALLLGGAGSLAYWQSSASTDAASFTTGTLSVEAHDDAAWTRDGEEIDPEQALLIPGQYIDFTQTFEVNVSGDGLLVTAEMIDQSFEPTDMGSIFVSVWIETDDGDVVEYIDNGVYEIKKSGTVTVKGSVSIDTNPEVAKDGKFTVSLGTLMLKQVAVLPTKAPCAC